MTRTTSTGAPRRPQSDCCARLAGGWCQGGWLVGSGLVLAVPGCSVPACSCDTERIKRDRHYGRARRTHLCGTATASDLAIMCGVSSLQCSSFSSLHRSSI